MLRAFFFRPKCLTLRGHVIALTTITRQQKFQVECPECPLTYIGETGRTLATRMKDHLNLRNPLTAVGEHCAHEHHKITKDSVKGLAREDIWLKRKVREAIKIKIGQPAMNRDQGYELPPSTMNFCCHVIVVKAIT